MACHHPIRGWRTTGGAVQLNRQAPDAEPLHLPCGGCLGCRTAAAKAWALRCHLELGQHSSAVFTTLTYDDAHCPPTLNREHLQKFLKRLRKRHGASKSRAAAALQRIRFFASGEYGETTARPHYHAILFGASVLTHADLINAAWGMGHTRTEGVTPARIAYCAGYTSKKIGFKRERGERVDPETGEVYEWEPPFIQMSRRPGIGGHAREHTQSWRSYAIHNGQHLPVPRFYHEAWKNTATAHEIERLEYEKQQHRQGKQPITYERLAAEERIAEAKQAIKADKRKL